MNKEELKTRTKEFAHRCVKLSTALPKTPLGRHIQSQLIRCATSVAANYRAACVAQSKKSFIAKLSIVIEEADESDVLNNLYRAITNYQIGDGAIVIDNDYVNPTIISYNVTLPYTDGTVEVGNSDDALQLMQLMDNIYSSYGSKE